MEQRKAAMTGFVVVAVFVPAAGCKHNAEDPAAAIASACHDYASALCARQNDCNAAALVESFVDVSTCTARFEKQCPLRLAAPGTGLTTQTLAGCVTALPTAACDQLAARALPASCTPAGTLPQGTPCGDDAQCATGYCQRGGTSMCGTCQTYTGKCSAESECAPGQECDFLNGVCHPAPPRTGPETTCDPTKDTCAAATYCSNQNVCTVFGLAQAGTSCRDVETVDGPRQRCAGGALCPAQIHQEFGTCSRLAEDGQGCGFDLICKPPAACKTPSDSSLGTCQLDPSTCH